ncbi:MAG TPA: riboflavin synthase [Acidobacteriaceae bacterium]
MFTGLIQAIGTVESRKAEGGTLRLAVHAPAMAARLAEGDSIAVSGVCLTALEPAAERFYAELAEETVARTSLGLLAAGSRVNLELPTPAGSPLGGHIVQGHVDATGTLMALDAVEPGSARTDWWLRLRVPPEVARYVVEKGSIAIEGISLTIARWDLAESMLSVAVIPHTWEATNLSTLKPGALLNLEADILMKLALEKQAPVERFTPTLAYLIANGY